MRTPWRKQESNLEELGETFDEAHDRVRASLDDLERTVASALLTLYPNRESIADSVASSVHDLGVDGIEVQAIFDGQQVTIVSAPDGVTHVVINEKNSLCTLSVGSDRTLWVEDIERSEFLAGHAAVGVWSAWCAAPIRIRGSAVGTVCALDHSQHVWTDRDREIIEGLAKAVGDSVEEWSANRVDGVE